MSRHTFDELSQMSSTEVLGIWRTMHEERQLLVARAGAGQASADDLKDYMQLRRDMQPVHASLIRRGIDIRYVQPGDTK